MIVILRKGMLLLALIFSGLLAQTAPTQPDDPALQTAERFLRRAVTAARDNALTQNGEAGQVLSAIRSAKDKDLLPIFTRLRKSKSLDTQRYAMISAALLTKDPAQVDLDLLLSGEDSALVGSAVAGLIDNQILSVDQLKTILAKDKQASHRVMAATELVRLKALPDRSILNELLQNEKDVVRFYTAVTMLDGADLDQTAAALAALHEMSLRHELTQLPIQIVMLVRVQRDGLRSAIPWVTQLAADEANDEGLRYNAVSVLLSLKAADGPTILADMIAKKKETIQQVKLSLIATQFGAQLQPPMLDPLVKSRSALVRSIAALALQAAQGADNTAGIVALIKEGHPIVLDWALACSDKIDLEERLPIRNAIVHQATIVDDVRDRDFEWAAVAAQRLLDDDGPGGRAAVAALLKSDNRAVVEATLAGIYRSSVKGQSELVLPIWDGLTRTTSTETAANYAALILAREGRKEPLNWLPGMIMGGTVQGPGFRALAGWYYAKLKGDSDAMVQRLLAD